MEAAFEKRLELIGRVLGHEMRSMSEGGVHVVQMMASLMGMVQGFEANERTSLLNAMSAILTAGLEADEE